MNDIRRKAPWYISDFTDAISLQSVASIFFLYFACLTPIITFGGLLGSATENRIVSAAWLNRIAMTQEEFAGFVTERLIDELWLHVPGRDGISDVGCGMWSGIRPFRGATTHYFGIDRPCARIRDDHVRLL